MWMVHDTDHWHIQTCQEFGLFPYPVQLPTCFVGWQKFRLLLTSFTVSSVSWGSFRWHNLFRAKIASKQYFRLTLSNHPYQNLTMTKHGPHQPLPPWRDLPTTIKSIGQRLKLPNRSMQQQQHEIYSPFLTMQLRAFASQMTYPKFSLDPNKARSTHIPSLPK